MRSLSFLTGNVTQTADDVNLSFQTLHDAHSWVLVQDSVSFSRVISEPGYLRAQKLSEYSRENSSNRVTSVVEVEEHRAPREPRQRVRVTIKGFATAISDGVHLMVFSVDQLNLGQALNFLTPEFKNSIYDLYSFLILDP
jgi:hypothetical protein